MANQGDSFFMTEASRSPSPARPPLSPSKSLPSVALRGSATQQKSTSSGRISSSVLSQTAGSGNSPPRSRRGLRKFANTVTAMMSMRNLSSRLGKKGKPRKPKVLNSYKLEPEEGTEFIPSKVEEVIEDILSQQLTGISYDAAAVKELVPSLSNLIKTKVKALDFNRHRIICNVTVVQNMGQGVEFASRCLWDDDKDSWACASFTSDSLFAFATVHGVYYE